MATIGNTVPTLVDVAKRLQPDGSLDRIAELLNQSNEIIQDVPMYEGNMLTGHLTTLRTSLPLVYWRRYNEGVLPSKSTTGQITEVTAMLEAWSEIDWDLLNLNNMSRAWRMSEESPFVESMGIEFVRVLFYGNMATDPKTFTGLATRFNDINIGESGSATKDGACIDAGGTGSDNTSVWLIGWGVNSVHGIYPKGSKALDRRPMNVAAANWRFYAARPIFTMLRIQSLTKSQYTTTFANVGGSEVGDFQGVPIRRVDQLLTTEARLT
jgi:hypothetical protein